MVVVDVEASGPFRTFRGKVPYHNMLELGAVRVLLDGGNSRIEDKFHAFIKPITEYYDPNSIKKTSGGSMDFYFKKGRDAGDVMNDFLNFVEKAFEDNGRRVHLASDNPDFDAGWIRLYFELFGINYHPYVHHNSVSIKDLARGLLRNFRTSLYRLPDYLRVNLPHTHNALDDAIRNAHILINLARYIYF